MPAPRLKKSERTLKVMRAPRSVDIDITNRCNLRCKYCYHFSSPGDVDKDLSAEEWIDFFKELGQCGVMHLTLAGGEPFVREDLRTLIHEIVNNRMRFSILSNGTLIDNDTAAFLASTGRCNHVQVSIDGSRPEIHDAVRGKEAFNAAVKGIRALQAFRVPVAVRVTIHKFNVADLDAVAAFLLDDLGVPAFTTNAASHMGLCRINSEKIALTVEERTAAMQTLCRLQKKYNGRISATAGPLAEALMWNEMEKARQNGKASPPHRGCLSACGCVWDNIAVRADGAIVPCTMLSHIELGRVNRDNFQKIWQDHPVVERMRKRSTISLHEFAFCAGCPYIDFCTGNCPGLAYTITAEVDHPSPDACLRKFLAEGGRLPDACM